MEHVTPAELEDAVRRARARAAKTGELRPDVSRSLEAPIPDDLADFLQRILTDGTYAREVVRIGEDDPDLANI
jgi:hypothetical protein